MPIDPTIATSGVQLNPMQSLASMLDVQAKQQQVQGNAISLKERQNLQRVMSDPSQFMDSDGRIDFNKALPLIMRAAPTTGMEHVHALVDAQSKATASQQAINAQTDENRGRIGQVLWGIQEDATPDVVHKTIDTLGQQYKGMDLPISLLKQEYDAAYKQGGAKAAAQVLKGAAQHVLPQPTQQTMATGQVSAIPTAGGTQLVQTAQGAAQPQGTPIGQPFTPPNQIINTPTGAPAVANTATGKASSLNNGDAPMVSLPAGETMDTLHAMQEQRTAVQQQANQAPVLHDINREVKATLAKGVTTGQLGGPIAKLKSTLGIGSEAAEQGASDYDILGKMLERSALTAAQGMGPQTNAGLEAQIKANGSQAYNPTALKKIANLNDALVTGSEKYRDGLEKAIEANPSLNVFVKRKFDQQWAANADPIALRLLNAAKNGDKEEISDIFKTVGGPKSKQGQDLRQKLMNLKALSETGQLQ